MKTKKKIKTIIKNTKFYNFYILFKLKLKIKKLNKLSKKDSIFLAQREINKFRKHYNNNPCFLNPKYFSEKILWQKICFENKLWSVFADKQRVKEVSKEILNTDISVKTLRIFMKIKDFNLENLPEKFVIKMNNGSGYIFLGKRQNNKHIFKNIKDIGGRDYSEKSIKRLFKILFKMNYSFENLEWPYRDIDPLLIIEEYLDENNLTDYKFHMNYGKFIFLNVVTGRPHNTRDDYYDEKFNRMNIWWDNPPSEDPKPLPKEIVKMKEYASLLSKDFPISRIDFYIARNKILLGEVTFFQNAGYFNIKHPHDLDLTLGRKFDISKDFDKNTLKEFV